MIGAIVARHNVKNAFRYLNERDLAAFMAGWSSDGVLLYPGELSVSGTVSGKKTVTEWFENFFQQFTSIKFTINHICVERTFDMTGNNNIVAQWSVELTNRYGRKTSNVGINLIKIRNRKVIEVRDFFYYPERLAIGWGDC